MDSSDLIVLSVVIGVVAGLIFGVVALAMSADSSSWITYNRHGQHCITLYRSNNHMFAPDEHYTNNWCKP